MKLRAGLWESLEQYAARLGCTPDKARITWRLQGLRRLFATGPAYKATFEDLVPIVDTNTCRVAPGVRVPTKHIEPTASGEY